MENVLHCPVCDFDYSHIIGTIQVKDNDNYQSTEFIINHTFPISAKVHYEYRSQGNIHILFICESGHYFIKSFDGHKGNIFVDENPLMNELTDFLNNVYKDRDEWNDSLDYELLANIEKFLILKQNG